MAQTPDNPELTASDVFATGVWSARGGKPTIGVDIACTKIAVDFQNLRRGTLENVLRESLNSLRDSTGVDTAFLWMFASDGGSIEEVYAAHGALAQCRVEAWRAATLDTYPWLKGRLDHLRLTEVRDSAAPRKDQLVEAKRLAELQIGSVLLIAIRVGGQPAGILGLANALPRGAWDVNLQLLLKLLGNSLAAGLERLRIEQRLHKLEERLELAQGAANDGLWDFDIESNEVHFSPRWKQMLGYPIDAQLDSPDWRSLVHPEDMSRVQSAIRDHVAEESVGHTITPFKDPEFSQRQGEKIRILIAARTKEMPYRDFVEMLRSAIKEDEWMLYAHGAIMGAAGGFAHLAIFGVSG